ncbi:MAG: hypothetical protein PHY42_01920 [Bacilli bacterium]|nr:hypothetical protein [Bacilli bacterium]
MKVKNEWLRKRIVMLKRQPNYIPLIMLCITCLVFNLRLTSFSNTIALINEPGMGFCNFVVVLCSFLSIITYILAYPRREKPKTVSIILVYAMLVISIGCQILFHYFIRYGTVLKPNPIEITPARSFVNVCSTMCIVHIVLLCICILLLALKPLYHKALLKIDTSIAIEETKIDKIDISDEV